YHSYTNIIISCSILNIRPPPSSTLFPYTTLFRSRIGAMDGPGFFLAQSVDEDSYNDAVYVTLTEYHPFSETETWFGLTLTFHLSAPQSKTVSFDYELIPASLQSPRRTGTVSFAPGQVQKTVSIYMNQHFVPPDPSADKFTLDQLRRLSWHYSARADYLH